MRVLIVEDDADLGEALTRMLRRDGHAADWQQDGAGAKEVIAYQDFDLIILDIELPKVDGFEVLRHLRQTGRSTPVLVLTARQAIPDRISALDVGADDYLLKPFDVGELSARCRALLRRGQGVASGVTTVGALTFDRSARSVRVDDLTISLPNREFRLLEIFIGNIGRVLTKEQIAGHLFDFDDHAGANAIELYVARLRQKLADSLTIRTVRGVGYIAEAPP